MHFEIGEIKTFSRRRWHRTGRTIKKAVKLPPETKNLLEKIVLLHVACPQ